MDELEMLRTQLKGKHAIYTKLQSNSPNDYIRGVVEGVRQAIELIDVALEYGRELKGIHNHSNEKDDHDDREGLK